ncbi:hypothetical protein [Methylibium sp.]|uniref:hypothetical protein n=1 Tax=Methylibium sp. TaxID=2067992 RepID=UPI003BAB94BB
MAARLQPIMAGGVGMARRRALQRAGFRPGRASHFHLLAQMKVTQAKGQKHIWPEHLPTGPGRCESVIVKDRAVYADKMDGSRWALFFGDFLLSQQKKVTRPPGRIPGAVPRGTQACRQGAADRAIPTTQQASAGAAP